MQRSVASSSRRTAIRFAELKRKRYWFPLMVNCFILDFFDVVFFVVDVLELLVLMTVRMVQIGIGLLVLQQLSGINGVLFYSSNIFANAGKINISLDVILPIVEALNSTYIE